MDDLGPPVTTNGYIRNSSRSAASELAALSASSTVAAVVPAYNAAELLPRCIESILSQTVPVAEVIVVDDGSTDTTRQVAESFGPPVKCISRPNTGLPGARNSGIRAATSEWIAFLDADDCWLQKKIEQQLNAAAEHPECALLYSDATVVLPDGSIAGNFLSDKGPVNGWAFDRLLESCFVLPSTVMARRSVLLDAGLFNESLRRVEDYELWLRLAQEHQFCMVPDSLTLYERQPDSLSRNVAAMLMAETEVLEPLLDRKLTPSQRASLKKRLARTYFDLSYEIRDRDGRQAVSLAWQSLRTDPSRLGSVKLLAASMIAALKTSSSKR
jgi:glycosyltransferase involved in cell wall biosynthesis